MKSVALFLICLIISSRAFGQECGEGWFDCKVYTLNGKIAKNLRYEIFSFPPSMEQLDGQWMERLQKAETYWGVLLSQKDFFEVCQTGLLRVSGLQVGLETNSGRSWPNFDPNRFQVPRTGAINNGTLSFRTKEGGWLPCIIKISSEQTACYVLCHPFSGCRNQVTVLWGENPQLADLRR